MSNQVVVIPAEQDWVEVSGKDATEFLNNLLSAELLNLKPGEGTHSLLLQPTGKLDVDLRIICLGDRWWCETEAGFGSQLERSLRRLLIRVDVQLTQLDLGSVYLIGENAPVVLRRWGASAPELLYEHVPHNSARIIRLGWPKIVGFNVVAPKEKQARLVEEIIAAGAARGDAEDLNRIRVEAGVPRMGNELDGKVIPQEALLERDAISFTKGCFLGQELVARIDSRGHVNRLLRRLRAKGETNASTGTVLMHAGKEVGSITSLNTVNPAVGLGFVRREVAPGELVDAGGTRFLVEEI